ncbi:hypothetical protein NPA08_00815 [Mycoplasmopsis citelli]|uniref:hypothetical protein n=1 Tax=Mycoplasmopsis citelli TaxID=171281 RepID=UPI0021151AB2|nr:hypothetical protein [Mycoplasmopsis citelli]UUD36366.1 hypothetical protein NPA08_00815 [Mycoplasmopsis citelli]
MFIFLEFNIISQEQYDKYSNQVISDEAWDKIKNGIIHYFEKLKNNAVINKEKESDFDKNHEIVTLDDKKGYQLNLIKGEENSKGFAYIYEKFKNLSNQIILIRNEIRNEIRNNLKYWTEVKADWIYAKLIISGAATASYIPINPFYSAGSFLGGYIAGLIIDARVSKIDRNIMLAEEKIKNYTEFLKEKDPLIKVKNIYNTAWSNISLTTNSINLGSALLEKFGKVGKLANTLKSISKILSSGVFKSISFFGDLVSIGFTLDDYLKVNNRISYINNLEREYNDLLKEFLKALNGLKVYKWVVIHETKQTNYYWKGGRGGRNLVFKNLQTEEVKTIDEMLKYSDWELRAWGLQRVRDRKKRRIYKNNTKQN